MTKMFYPTFYDVINHYLRIPVSNPYFSQFVTIAIVHLLAVASPGPDFAVIVRQSISYGKRTAIWTSLGVGCGILIHVCYSLLGIGVIISRSIVVFNALKIVGACYLIFIGLKTIRARPRNTAIITGKKEKMLPSRRRAMWTGFLTNGLNPKATLFFLSLFTVVIDPKTPLTIQAGYGIYMALATAVWFCGISLFFGHQSIRHKFLKIGHWFERITGAVLILLGLRLAIFSQK